MLEPAIGIFSQPARNDAFDLSPYTGVQVSERHVEVYWLVAGMAGRQNGNPGIIAAVALFEGRKIMIRLRLLLMVAVVVLSAPQLRADISARVCNTGNLDVDVAVAYEDPGVIRADWVISAWHRISPDRCKQIYHNSTACEMRYNFTPCAHVYVAYAFTDSTGVWGAADLKDPN